MQESEADKKTAIAKSMMELEFRPVSDVAPVSANNSTKIPFAELALAGGALASLYEPFRTLTQTAEIASGQGLYSVAFKDGLSHALTPFKKGGGFMGMTHGATGIEALARLTPVDGATTITTTTIPVDPMTLAIAVALAEVNRKLDAIQKTQQDMFDFLKQREESKLRGDLKILADVLNQYKYNWDNEKYKTNKHILVQDIRREAERGIDASRSDIAKKVSDKSPFHIGVNVDERTAQLKSLLKDYQLALYLYSFASFLEVLLLENFEEDYLDSFSRDIQEHSLQYRQTYTQCSEHVEEFSQSSIGSTLLGGLSMFAKSAGDVVSKTPLGEVSPLDEALLSVGDGMGQFRSALTNSSLSHLTEERGNNVLPFIENIQAINRMHNRPTELLVGQDGIYIRQLGS